MSWTLNQDGNCITLLRRTIGAVDATAMRADAATQGTKTRPSSQDDGSHYQDRLRASSAREQLAGLPCIFFGRAACRSVSAMRISVSIALIGVGTSILPGQPGQRRRADIPPPTVRARSAGQCGKMASCLLVAPPAARASSGLESQAGRRVASASARTGTPGRSSNGDTLGAHHVQAFAQHADFKTIEVPVAEDLGRRHVKDRRGMDLPTRFVNSLDHFIAIGSENSRARSEAAFAASATCLDNGCEARDADSAQLFDDDVAGCAATDSRGHRGGDDAVGPEDAGDRGLVVDTIRKTTDGRQLGSKGRHAFEGAGVSNDLSA